MESRVTTGLPGRSIHSQTSRIPDDMYELFVQQRSVNHPDYEYITGGVDDEFDQTIWEEDEHFQAWYWELD